MSFKINISNTPDSFFFFMFSKIKIKLYTTRTSFHFNLLYLLPLVIISQRTTKPFSPSQIRKKKKKKKKKIYSTKFSRTQIDCLSSISLPNTGGDFTVHWSQNTMWKRINTSTATLSLYKV